MTFDFLATGLVRRSKMKKSGARNLYHSFIATGLLVCSINATSQETVTMSTDMLRDKIKGAWAAQTIGVTYGFPVEFRFNSARVPDEREIPW